MSVTLVFSGFLHQQSWPSRYNWNIVESGVKHHNCPLSFLSSCGLRLQITTLKSSTFSLHSSYCYFDMSFVRNSIKKHCYFFLSHGVRLGNNIFGNISVAVRLIDRSTNRKRPNCQISQANWIISQLAQKSVVVGSDFWGRWKARWGIQFCG